MTGMTQVDGEQRVTAGHLSDERLRELFREMLVIRRFEEKVEERFRAGELPGFLHVAIGQEAVACGVCAALEPDDVISSTHRAHAHTIAKGTSIDAVMAEMYGKQEGCSGGFGGSMHLYDIAKGNMGANAVVGGGLPMMAGAALAFKLKGEPRVAVPFFGDGATNTGAFHESMNLAQLWKLPVLFVLENNGWAESTPAAQQLPLAVEDMHHRALAYGMHHMEVDGQDVEAVYAATREAREHVSLRRGPGIHERPHLSVHRPLRRRPAGLPRQERGARAGGDARPDRAPACPARHLRGGLRAPGCGGAGRGRRERRVRQGRHRSGAGGRAQMGLRRRLDGARLMAEITYREAVRDVLSSVMRDDDRVFMMGEDIAEMGGSMGVTTGMLAEFGPERIRNTPISEIAIVGAGIGAAVQGMLPVVEIMYEDFLTISMEQIVNQAAKHRTMSGGQVKVPLTIRTQGGAGWSPGAQHAQQLEAWFTHVPGLKVVFASTPEDVRGLLWSAIYDPNPVIFFEHRTLYPIKGEVPDAIEPIPLGQARVHREGTDCTVVATGRLVHEALRAAEDAAGEGISIEVVDPRTLSPLDTARSSRASRRRPAASRRTRPSSRAASGPSWPP